MNEALLQNAWRLHQAGNFSEAARLYQEVLRLNPRHFGALQMLGFLHFQRAEFDSAEKLMARALKIEPKSVDALYNRGCALQALDRHKDALQCFDKALSLKREYPPAHLNRGTSLFRLGRKTEALTAFDRALVQNPNYPEALLNRGNARLELGRAEDALADYERAIGLDPRQPILWNNRGNVLAALLRDTDALTSYEKALALDPRYGDAIENRADTLARLGRHAEALAAYERAIALQPANAELAYKRGHLLAELKRPSEALAAFDASLARDPGNVAAAIGKGVALTALERHREALAAFDAALAADPANADALSNRANTLIALKRFSEALVSSEEALRRAPRHLAALHNRGTALSGLRRFRDAIAGFDAALAVMPGHAVSINGRGAALLGLKRHDEALAEFDRALAAEPDMPDVLTNRATVLTRMKRYGEAAQAANRALALSPGHAAALREHVHAKLNSCTWQGREQDKAAVTAALAAGSRGIHPFDALSFTDSEMLNRTAATLYVNEEWPVRAAPWHGQRQNHERLRVGYLSTDFRAHAVGFLIVGTLEHHDKRRFETIGLSIAPDDGSTVRTRIANAFDRFVDLDDKDDAEAAQLLRAMEIDILVDLNGFTGEARTAILAQRAAPIQVNYLGYPGTMAAPFIDYIIADPAVIPQSAATAYSECIAYLPDTYQANDNRREVSDAPMSRRDAGLPENAFIFCSLSSSYKFAPDVFAIWMRLLRTVKGSVLWLLHGDALSMANLHREAEAAGVSPARVIFAPHAPPAEHLARQRLADLFLDTLPYNAHTTASDALWMGLPVVTSTGATFAGRVATSILNAAGLPELVRASLADYEALALRLATNRDAYAAIKAKVVASRASALFDTARFTRHLESAYETMWARHVRGEAPQGFAVPAEPRQ